MSDLNKLLESGLLDEETTTALKEAIDNKVNEKLEEQKETLREEFVKRYEHDKKVMIEAADQMFNETLAKEIKEFRSERQEFVEARVEYKKMLREHAKLVRKFVAGKLHEEIKELRTDRKELAEALMKFEQFAVKHLSRELNEFHEDQRELVETKVKLIKDAKSKIDETKKDFIRKAALITEGFVESVLRKEMKAFRKDIKEARKNNFGRRLFEAFAAEFMTSHISDGTQMKRLLNAVKERDEKLAEANEALKSKNKLIESANTKQRLAEGRLVRHKKMNELLSPLPRAQKELMAELLESVDTANLDSAYKKHIKYVLNENVESRKALNENRALRREVTGNKETINESVDNHENDDEILTLKKRAGII